MTGTLNDNWTIVESEHYIFHFSANSLAEKNLESIIESPRKMFQIHMQIIKSKFSR